MNSITTASTQLNRLLHCRNCQATVTSHTQIIVAQIKTRSDSRANEGVGAGVGIGVMKVVAQAGNEKTRSCPGWLF